MKISQKDWLAYITKLSRLDRTAADKMRAYANRYGLEDTDALVDYAYGIATKYGEGSAALAAEMYDITAELSGKNVPPAELAPTPDYYEVAKTVYGTKKSTDLMANAIGRLVKRTGADTTIKNAIRDGAYWAWIPHGDTCAFCITLASRGWQKASRKSLKNGHAEHIHANCDCTYAVSFDGDTQYGDYDPDQYLEMYENAEGTSSKDKINSLRRQKYQQNKDKINAQKRAAYAERKERSGLTGERSGGIILTEMYRAKDRTRKREGYSFISDKRFDDITIPARKNGAIILRGGEDIEQHLDSVGANAACLNDILMFRKNVTVSEALEETRHFEQNRKRMNFDKPDDLRDILNEIDAKQYIIDNSAKYGIPKREIDETREQLSMYQKRLKEYEDV